MKRKLRNGIREAFEPPKSPGKEAFLRNIWQPTLDYRGFLLSQLHYIRKRVWILSFLFVMYSLLFLLKQTEGSCSYESVWIIGAMLPFLALTAVSETIKSGWWGMQELELSCRYSLNQVIFARLLFIGSGNLITLTVILVLTEKTLSAGFFRTGLYLLTPYLLTCALCLILSGRVRGREGRYGYAVTAAAVSAANSLLRYLEHSVYQPDYLIFWLFSVGISAGIIVYRLHCMKKEMEARSWNLYLAE